MDFRDWQRQNPQAVLAYKFQLAEYQRKQTLPYLHMLYNLDTIQPFHFQAEVPLWMKMADSKGRFILPIRMFTKQPWEVANPTAVTKEIKVGNAVVQELGVIGKETIVTDKPVEEALKEKGINKDGIGEYHATQNSTTE